MEILMIVCVDFCVFLSVCVMLMGCCDVCV